MLHRTQHHPRRIRAGRIRAACLRAGAACLLSACLLPLAACAGFFQCAKASCPTTTTGGSGGSTNTGDYAYVANSSAGTTYLSGYNVSGGTLASLGTFSLGYIPVALAVAPGNGYLYVASVPGATNPGIYSYAISTTGTLSVQNSGNPWATDTVASMDISPDGNWLYTINTNGLTLTEYQVTSGTGSLKVASVITLPLSICTLTGSAPVSQTCTVKVAPSGEYVFASLGAAGDAVFTYTSASGITGTGFQTLSAGSTTAHPTGDFSVAVDANNYAYVAQTTSMTVYGITSSGITNEGTVGYATGSVPRSVTLSHSDNYVYTANEGAGTISGFGISGSGTLNAASGSPFAGPTNVSALGADNTGNYLVAVGYDASTGVRLYSVSAVGVLTQVAAAGTGTVTTYPALLAMTH